MKTKQHWQFDLSSYLSPFNSFLIILNPISILPCTCRNLHKWVINLIDHHTKFVNSHPLHAKSADEVLDAVKNYLFSYGYKKKILTDIGGEFCNAKVKSSCPMERQQLQPHKVLWKEATL